MPSLIIFNARNNALRSSHSKYGRAMSTGYPDIIRTDEQIASACRDD